jgi:hypothetical protein
MTSPAATRSWRASSPARASTSGAATARPKVNGVVLGATVTNHQAYLRRRPPLRVPVRTPAERLVQSWTPAELEAITYEIRAGRYTVIPRGRSGLPERSMVVVNRERWLEMKAQLRGVARLA